LVKFWVIVSPLFADLLSTTLVWDCVPR